MLSRFSADFTIFSHICLLSLLLFPIQGFERSREPRAPTPVNPPSTRLFVANLGSANENQLVQVTCVT